MTRILIASLVAALLFVGCGASTEGNVQNASTSVPTSHGQTGAATRTLTVPVGTLIDVRLNDPLGSATSRVGDTFTASTLDDVVVAGEVAIPRGSRISGTVTEAKEAPRGAGNARLTLAFGQLTLPGGYSTRIVASLSERSGSKKGRNAGIIGGSAAGGALLGRILGKDTRGAVVGSIVGGAIGTAVVVSKEGEQVELPSGTVLTIELEQPTPVRSS